MHRLSRPTSPYSLLRSKNRKTHDRRSVWKYVLRNGVWAGSKGQVSVIIDKPMNRMATTIDKAMKDRGVPLGSTSLSVGAGLIVLWSGSYTVLPFGFYGVPPRFFIWALSSRGPYRKRCKTRGKHDRATVDANWRGKSLSLLGGCKAAPPLNFEESETPWKASPLQKRKN